MPTILLADDSTHAQRMGTKILAAEGVEVIAVSNGDACVKKLAELDVDMVLADVYMPGLDGYEVCQWIKASPNHSKLPVVLVVGALELYEPDRIAQVHADGLLKKPFEASAMLETVRPLLAASVKLRAERKPAKPAEKADVGDTIEIPPPAASRTGDTPKVAPSAPAAHSMPDLDSTVKIPPPPGAVDLPDVDSTIRIPPPKGAKEFAEPAHEPTIPVTPPPSIHEIPMMEVPVTEAEMHVAMHHEDAPPPLAEMAMPEPEIPVMEVPETSADFSPGEFAIPDIGEHHTETGPSIDDTLADVMGSAPAEAAAPPPVEAIAEPPALEPEPEPEPESTTTPSGAHRKWVAEQVAVTSEDQSRFGDSAAKAPSAPEPPPDWSELLKSVEETSGSVASAVSSGRAAAAPAPAPKPAPPAPPPPPTVPVAAKAEPSAETVPAPSSSDLELEIVAPPAPEPPPPPPPEIDEEEIRMAVQLCLERALPGIIDEITAAVMRRVKGD